jgi:hypothetical protein
MKSQSQAKAQAQTQTQTQRSKKSEILLPKSTRSKKASQSRRSSQRILAVLKKDIFSDSADFDDSDEEFEINENDLIEQTQQIEEEIEIVPKRLSKSVGVKSHRSKVSNKYLIITTGLDSEKALLAEQIVTTLGGVFCPASDVTRCTHVIADRILRTMKFLQALPHSPLYCTFDWLVKSYESGQFLAEEHYLVKV